MRKILTDCLAPFIFIILFLSFTGSASAGALPDWDIDFTWNGVEVADSGQYPLHLNEEKPSSYAWPGGEPNIYGEIYKGELHNAGLISAHELGNFSPSLQTDVFLEPGHYFVVVYTDYYPAGGCGDGGDFCIIPDREDMQLFWFKGWEGFFNDGYAPMHWGIINFEVTEAVDEPPPTDLLILKYEPILYLHPDENYQPMNMKAFVEHSSLWDDMGIMEDALLKAENLINPVTLDDIATTTDTSDWYLSFSDGANPKSFSISTALAKYNQLLTSGKATTTYYWRKMTDSYIDNEGQMREFVVLQYWYFYAFNDWREHGGFNNHEGDWESVMIFLDKNTEEPKYVAYSSHHNDGDPSFNIKQYDSVRRNWDVSEVDMEANQVKSYVALGSHANYPKNESGGHIVPFGIIDYIDKTSTEGNHLTSNIWENKRGISSDLPEWVYHYEGKWGADTMGVGGDGPQGPNFIEIGGIRRFQNPVKWAGIDKIGEKTIIEIGIIDTVNFATQKTKLVFDNAIEVGVSFLVDLHEELVNFGENIQEVTLLPYFWDMSSSLENNTFSAEVSFNYNEEDLNLFGAPEDLLSVFVFNETKKIWEEVSSTVDAAGDIISFMITHFSRYAIGVKNWQDITDSLKIIKHPRHYNPETGTIYVDVRLQNRTDKNIVGDLRLVIKDIDEEEVKLLNNAGTTTTEGLPYVDVKLESPLPPKHFTKPIKLEFSLPIKETKTVKTKKEEKTIYIPEFIKFDFDVIVQQLI